MKFVLMTLAIISAHSSLAQILVPNLQGKWQMVATGSVMCREIYEFLDDKRLVVKSADELIEKTYSIESAPHAPGFFKLDSVVKKDHGGVDCGGSKAVILAGTKGSNYIQFRPDGKAFILCYEPTKNKCWGIFKRAL